MAEAREAAHPVTLPDPPRLVLDDDLVLRLPVVEDAADIVAHCNDPEMIRWTTVPSPYGLMEAYVFVAGTAPGWRTNVASLAIEYQGRFSGGVNLVFDNHGSASVGYGLAPWARGQGVMTRSLRAMLAWGFELPGLHVVTWDAIAGNQASLDVACRCGFQIGEPAVGSVKQRGVNRDAWTGSLRRGDPLHGPR
jgi:RimJ/RimL family protein N-acetyltransferase